MHSPSGPQREDHHSRDPIALRLRVRRLAMGLALAEVARRAGLMAPSFVHHVETGLRIPSEEVAARLARAVGENETLFRAWARLRGGAVLDQALAAARVVEEGVAPADAAAPPALMRVPLLAEGGDPDAPPAGGDGGSPVLRFDARALPPETWWRPFAYRLAAPPARCEGRLAAGDLVVLTRNAGPIHPQAIYAARGPGGVTLGPLAWRDDTLWLASVGGGPAEALAESGTPPRALAGRVAAVIRGRPG